MTTTTAHTTIEQISDTLDALEAEWFTMIEIGEAVTYRKREVGGYFVEYNGLRLGWVVKEHQTNKWVAYIYGTAGRGRGTNVGFNCPKRADAAESVVVALLFSHRCRVDFEAYWEEQITSEARIATIIAAILAG